MANAEAAAREAAVARRLGEVLAATADVNRSMLKLVMEAQMEPGVNLRIREAAQYFYERITADARDIEGLRGDVARTTTGGFGWEGAVRLEAMTEGIAQVPATARTPDVQVDVFQALEDHRAELVKQLQKTDELIQQQRRQTGRLVDEGVISVGRADGFSSDVAMSSHQLDRLEIELRGSRACLEESYTVALQATRGLRAMLLAGLPQLPEQSRDANDDDGLSR